MRKATNRIMKTKNSALAIQNVVRLINPKPKTPAIRPKHRKTIAHTNMIDSLRMCNLPPVIIPLMSSWSARVK